MKTRQDRCCARQTGRDWHICACRLGLWAVASTVLMSTHATAIQLADSGEVTAAACQLGVVHPPGYPLYTMIGHLFCRLPWSTPAARLSLLSALAALAMVSSLFSIVMRLTGAVWAALATALSALLVPIVWRQASHAEVFAPHLALSVAMLDLATLSLVRRGTRFVTEDSITQRGIGWHALGLGGLAGLALSHHHSAVMLLPCVIVALVVGGRGWRDSAKQIALALVGGIAGLSPYLYLYWAEVDHLPRWGTTQHVAGLWHHVLRRDYGTFTLALGEHTTAGASLTAWLGALPEQLGWPWLLGASLAMGWCVAIVFCGRRVFLGTRGLMPSRRVVALCLGVAPVLSGPVFLALFNLDVQGIGKQVVERFFALPLVLLVLVAGVGVGWLEAELCQRRLVRYLWALGLMVLVTVRALQGHAQADLRKKFVVEDYAYDVLRAAEPGALILGVGDVRLFSINYLQQVLGVARDRQYVDVRMLLYPWYVEQQRRSDARFDYRYVTGHVDTIGIIQRALAIGRPVYLAVAYNQRVTRSFVAYPVGPLQRLLPVGQAPPPLEDVARKHLALDQQSFRRGRDPDPLQDPWSASLREPFAQGWYAIAGAYAARGDKVHQQQAMDLARRWAPWLEKSFR